MIKRLNLLNFNTKREKLYKIMYTDLRDRKTPILKPQ